VPRPSGRWRLGWTVGGSTYAPSSRLHRRDAGVGPSLPRGSAEAALPAGWTALATVGLRRGHLWPSCSPPLAAPPLPSPGQCLLLINPPQMAPPSSSGGRAGGSVIADHFTDIRLDKRGDPWPRITSRIYGFPHRMSSSRCAGIRFWLNLLPVSYPFQRILQTGAAAVLELHCTSQIIYTCTSNRGTVKFPAWFLY
jgi:hypothetical protein